MRAVLAEKWPRLFLTLLLALGLAFSVLGVLNLDYSPASCAGAALLLALVLEGVALNRRSALWGSAALVLLFFFWLLGGGGLSLLTDLSRAFTLEFYGVPGALPLVSREAALTVTLALTLLSFLTSRKRAGCLGALLLAVGALLLLWLGDRPDLMPWLLPALIAALVLLLLERHQEVSFLRILSWVAALVLLGYGLTPRSGVIDPSLKEQMDSLRQNIMDRLFFTEPRDVFSLLTEGFYPQGISQLGGPVTPRDHPVMQVSAPRAVYLRGVLMNEYDGRAWRNTLGGRRYLWDASGMAVQRAVLFDQNLPSAGLSSTLTEPSPVSVRMLGDGASTIFTPQRIRDLRAGGELVPYFTNSSELFATRNLQAGDTWSVSAPLFRAGDPGLGTLIDAASSAADAQWETVRDTYTQLPSHLEEPVWQLAADVTESQSSAYEKAFALQNYLARNYRYTLEVDYQPASLDFVTNFLFNTREGYCTYFASAMTVLCRMAGLPARYVEGYLAEPNAQGEALVTGLNAHAWTEVYFRGFGWLTFDATPRRTDGSSPDSSALSPQTPTPPAPQDFSPTPPPAETELTAETPTPPEASPEETPDPNQEAPQETPTPDPGVPSPEPSPEDSSESGSPGLPGWLLLPLLLLLLALAVLFRWLWTAPDRREKKCDSESARFDLWLEDVLQRLSAAGERRRTGETLMNFTRRLDAEGRLPVSLAQLGECASLLHYGRVHALETDTALAREASRGLQRSLPRKARLRYALRRLFRPGSLFPGLLRKHGKTL